MNFVRQKFCHGKGIVVALVAMAVLYAGGCNDFLAGKNASRESSQIIDEVGKFKITIEPNIPLPQFYKEPPKIVEQIVGGKKEWKLFYFCKFHTSNELKQIANEQFASQLFDEKGKSTRLADYTVSSNPATNQLIVRCPYLDDINAVLEFLIATDVEPVQVKIDCIISELYADRTLDWSTTLLIEELFGEGIWAGPAAQDFGTSVSDLLTEPDTLPSFPGASIREIIRARMGLKVGYSTNKYLALVDILESQGYLKILMNPTLEVVNGKTAKVSSSQRVPLQEITTVAPQVEYVQTQTEYIEVIDSLEITPHVFADGTIGLETKIQLGSKLTPEGVKQLPIITKKEIENKENRIRRGESLIIGGIRKSEKRDVVRGIPGLKDIPIAGMLFSGRDFEERVVETIFILTPYVSTGGIPGVEMAEYIKSKHKESEEPNEPEIVMDPFGFNALKKEYERKVTEADRKADEKAKQAQAEAEKIKSKAEVATAEAEKNKAEAEKLMTEAKKVIADAQAKAKAADEAKAVAEKAANEAATAKAEAERVSADAAKTREQAEQAISEAQAKARNAEAAKAAADKAIADAAQAKAEAEKIKAEAEKKKEETQKTESGEGTEEAKTEDKKAEVEA